ncbi:MAG: transposase [Candidatus Aenigmarchaeota archaeon]|nr:transposase [Candidatus Aenigmarchaeota archaeon]
MSKTFIHEFLLKTSPKEEKILLIILEFARFLYNAVLGEGLRRIKLIKESKLNAKAKKEKNYQIYNELNKFYNFSDYALQAFAIKTKNNCSIKNHLDTHVCQKIATRAYLALQRYLKKKAGKPRFKSKNRFFSIEGKSNIAGLKFKNNKLYYKGLELDIVLDEKDKYRLQEYALSKKVKYCRLIKKRIKNKNVFFLQLVLEGDPFIKEKNKSKDFVVGLDIGPSTYAVFSDEKAILNSFCSELTKFQIKKKNLQRKMNRSLKAMNPENYNEDGTIKKILQPFKKSKKYLNHRNKLFETFRKLKTYRKRLHSKLANEVIKLGKRIRTEKLSFKGFQKLWGRSINFRAPSLFLSILNRKAENAGGSIDLINTRKTALSQTCHNCESKKKKELKQRWHECDCKIKAQRDLYSAFLARYVKEDTLDICQAKKAWPSANRLLEQAISRLKQTAIGSQKLSSFGLNQSQSGSLVKDRSIISDTLDVVGSSPRAFGSL